MTEFRYDSFQNSGSPQANANVVQANVIPRHGIGVFLKPLSHEIMQKDSDLLHLVGNVDVRNELDFAPDFPEFVSEATYLTASAFVESIGDAG